MEYETFIVGKEEAGERLDRFVVLRAGEMSRARVQTLIEETRVRVNGASRKPSYRVEAGETVTIEIPPARAPGVKPEAIPLEVLYEDEELAVINKPAGMIVHPGAGAERSTLVGALLDRFGKAGLSSVGGPLRPGIVHRLDKGTSGALVIARTDAAHRKLAEAFRDRKVEKTYLALLHGRVKGESGRIELPVTRDLKRRTRMTARRRFTSESERRGRDARTDWRVQVRMGGLTLVEADLHTGRTHQIRAHFSALGWPVVGDTLYGAPRQERVEGEPLPALCRTFLHAARLAFAHPTGGQRIEARAPLAPELAEYLRVVAQAAKSEPRLIDAIIRESKEPR